MGFALRATATETTPAVSRVEINAFQSRAFAQLVERIGRPAFPDDADGSFTPATSLRGLGDLAPIFDFDRDVLSLLDSARNVGAMVMVHRTEDGCDVLEMVA